MGTSQKQDFKPAERNPSLAVLLVLTATAFFATSTFLAKTLGTDTFGDPLHPLQVSHGRFLFAFLAIAIVATSKGIAPRTENIRLHILRTVFGFIGVTLMFAAVALIPLGDAIAISFLNPVFAMIFAVLMLSERVGRWRWISAAVAFLGALILLRPTAGAIQPGALVALGAAIIIGVEIIFIKRLSGREHPLRILLINNSIGAVIATLAVIWVWAPPTMAQWLALTGVGVSMVIGQGLFVNSLARSDTSFVAPFSYMTLIYATLLDMAIYSVWPDLASGLGAGLIIGAGIVLAWREGRARNG